MASARDSELKARLLKAEQERDALAKRLSGLEQMLTDPERGENAILYFRLREIWDACHRGLVVMADHFLARHSARLAPGEMLSLVRRRGINTMLIASAQEYYLAYREEQIADMARLAMRKPVEEVLFGLSDDCLRWQALVRELSARLSIGENNNQEYLRARTRYLHRRLRFDEGVSRPRADSLNSMPNFIPAGELPLTEFTEVIPVNVLALDYWGLGEVLLP
ncbi:MAG: hypothetical protein ACRESR_06350 [Gammaproteobacteria bacterium]